jgi:hypothetical protein
VLRWQTLGLILRLVSWPMGFIMLAKGAKGWYFWTELISNLISLGFMWIGIRLFGLVGAGVAFFALYVFYVFLALCVSKYLTGFAWRPAQPAPDRNDDNFRDHFGPRHTDPAAVVRRHRRRHSGGLDGMLLPARAKPAHRTKHPICRLAKAEQYTWPGR